MNVVVGDRVEIFCVNNLYGDLLNEDSNIRKEQRRGIIVCGAEEESFVHGYSSNTFNLY